MNILGWINKYLTRDTVVLSPKSTIGPESTLKQFPLLYVYFDSFYELSKACKLHMLELGLHQIVISKGISAEDVIKDENLFFELYTNKLLRLQFNDGTELRKDSEEDYWDRVIHPEKYSEELLFRPDVDKELMESIISNHKKIDAIVNTIKLRYGLESVDNTQNILQQITIQQAETGDANAQYNLGMMYVNGQSVPLDYNEAIKWLAKSAEQGFAAAQFNLGIILSNSQGIPQDYNEAIKWLTKSAEQGFASAQNNLGVMYSNGQGVPQDDREAIKWFIKAADQGLADAQYNLGEMYGKGCGVPQDDNEAIKWYSKAAEQGNSNAQFCLGVRHQGGIGVPQNGKEAVKWYTKAAEQGHAMAQCGLGILYCGALGVPENFIEAYKWTTLAAAQDLELAIKQCDDMEQFMSSTQIKKAFKLSREFNPKHSTLDNQ